MHRISHKGLSGWGDASFSGKVTLSELRQCLTHLIMVYPMQAADIEAELSRTLFGKLGAPLLTQLIGRARIEEYEMPTLLNPQGRALEWIRLVVRGHIEIIARRANGDEVSIADIGPGGWATWIACFVATPPDHDFVSSASACYIALPAWFVRETCFQNPALYPLIFEEVGLRMRQLMEWTGQSVLVTSEQRMAKLIHLLARTQAIGTNSGTLYATQARLARLARCSRQTANLLLGSLESKGLIRLSYGRFEIDDLTRLAAFSEAESAD